MKKSEIISITILVILLIILAISIWAGSGSKSNSSTTTAKSPCEVMCRRQTHTEKWVFQGESFSSQEECVSQCKATLKPAR